MATRPARPVRSVRPIRSAVVSLALVAGTLAGAPGATAASGAPRLGSGPLLPMFFGDGCLLQPCPVTPPQTTFTGMTPTPNSAEWVNRRTVHATFDYSYPGGEEPPAQDAKGNATPTTFECRLDGPAPRDWAACTSPVAYTGLPDTDRGDRGDVHTISVRAVHPDGTTRDETPARGSFRLDATAQDTYLLGAPTLAGPRQNLLLDNVATFRYAVLNHSDETNRDPVFRCTFDGRALPCPGTQSKTTGSRTLTGIRAGDHRFTVVGVDQAGNVAQTPEAFAFHMPYNRVGLRRQIRRRWTHIAAPGHYLDDYVVTRTKGSVLSRRFRDFDEAYLIVAKGPGHGRIRVDIGNTRVKTVRLGARKFRRTRIVRLTIPGGRRMTGRIKVTVISPDGRPVMIDAIAVR